LKSPGGKRSGPAGFGPAGTSGGGCEEQPSPSGSACQRVALNGEARPLHLTRRPVRLGGTASVGSFGGRGARIGPGGMRGFALSARCRPPRRPSSKGPRKRKTRASFYRGAGDECSGGQGLRVGAGNPAPARSRTPRTFAIPSVGQGRRHGGPERPVLNGL
jgi:hypothetical protein